MTAGWLAERCTDDADQCALFDADEAAKATDRSPLLCAGTKLDLSEL